ncbi:MAG TPA: alpha-amylase family glycosyl hydrolase [Chloroflexota bacterium]
MDSNGDGTGDLPGILSRLDYLQWLGVDAIWISPIFPSPMADFGYDVASYTDIEPIFGTLADFDALVEAAHRHDMRVILDYVPNHSSDQHPWFVTSRSSRQNDKRDWYLWRDGSPAGGPPNNWLSAFGGSGWEWDPSTAQFYYHAYLKEQPDLNWRNPDLKSAMYDVLRFWFERGVDGFRIDALRQVVKDAQFRDNPPDPDWSPGQDPYRSLLPLHSADQPELMDIVHDFRAISDGYPDRVLIGELWLSIDRLVAYYGREGRGLHLPFNFHLILTPWQAPAIAALIDTYEAALPPNAWPNWVLGNHDRPRVATRVGAAQARVAAMLLLTLRGTPTVYNGDEIGMHDVPIPPELVQDPFEKNVPGLGVGRDPERTPLQWSAAAHAGFTQGSPWLPIADDFAEVNVERQRDDPRSMLTLHRRLIELRRRTPALSVGGYTPVHADDDLLVYERAVDDERVRVALNLSHAGRAIPWSEPRARVLISTHLDRDGEVGDRLDLRADEGVVVRC